MRLTKARKAIIGIFSDNHSPISATELLIMLSNQKLNVNKTTVYRELEYMQESNLVREVTWDDSIKRYEASDPHCHHHVVCKNCGKVVPVHLDEQNLLTSIEKQSKFKLDKHIIEFFGYCEKCI